MSFNDKYYNYKSFNLNLHIKDGSAIDGVAEEILPKLNVPQTDRNKKYLVVLILNVYQNYCMKKNMYTGFSQTRNNYQKKSRYNKNAVSNAIIEINKEMIEKKYISDGGYFHGREAHKKSYTLRIQALPKLIKIINKHKVDYNKIHARPDTECIILKKKQGKKNVQIEYEDTEDLKQHRKNLTAYNNLLHKTHIDVVGLKEEGVLIGNSKSPICVNQNNKWTKRIFIKEDNHLLYGRFHGGFWVPMNREWRSKILINGLDTTEIDYSGMGINTLYDINNLDIDDKDPYDLTGYYNNNKYSMKELRPLLKQLLMVMINSKSSVQARNSIQSDVNDVDNDFPDDIDINRLMKAFQERHKPIKHLFFQSMGNLQYLLDSSVCAEVINYFTFKNIPVLTVHDSFVISIGNGDELREVMQDAYSVVLKKYKKQMKVKFENKQYERMMAYRNLTLPEASNPVEEMN